MDQLGTNTDGSVATAATADATDSTDATDATDVIGATPTASTIGSTPTTASTAASALQTSYDNMVTASGGSASTSPSLSQFLQTLSQNLHGAPTSGNIVSTQA